MPMLASLELVAMAIERRAQRLIDPRDQRVNVLGALDAVLQDGEFIAAEAGDEIFAPTDWRNRSATPFRNSSPIRCPSVSLMRLNSSMSI